MNTPMRKTGSKGIALLIVLWVLTIMTIIVLSFSYMTRAEAQASLTFRNQTVKKFLAEAGVERGVMEMFYRRQNGQGIQIEGLEVWRTDGTPYKIETEGGFFTVSVIDESGKLNLNTLNETSGIILKNLLMNSGVKEETADTIVDSILDWKDPDDLVRLHGAESQYYSSLRIPYKAKNANFDSIEELLLIKGMTTEILRGDGKKKGLADLVTVYANTSAINLLAAPKEVIKAIPGLGDPDVEAILSLREGPPNDPAALQTAQGIVQKIKPPFNNLATVGGESSIYTIESLGNKGTDKAGYGIKATVSLTSTPAPTPAGASVTIESKKAPFTYLAYRSPANIKQQEEKDGTLH